MEYQKKINPSWNMYFLSWIDALEKLDILVLELRHLQLTCIYSLRLPELMEVLRYEEVLLDPRTNDDKWNDLLKDKEFDIPPTDDSLDYAKNLIEKYVWLFPSDISPVNYQNAESEEERVVDKLRKTLHECWLKGIWSDARKDLYEVLASAQKLKRQILADRFFLFFEGETALFKKGNSSGENLKEYGPNLFIKRIAVLSRSENYLARVGDLQQRLAQHIEVKSQEYPRPSVHRRRVQGVYTHYLIDRVKYIRESMNLLLGELRGQNPLSHPKVFHLWLHDDTSSQAIFSDEFDGIGNQDSNELRNVEFVRTGFWMPDKPDNQPILAHELAHHAVRQHYDNLLSQTLSSASFNDDFARLMREIIHALDSFEAINDDDLQFKLAVIDPTEIACDLLAGGIKGVAYLYAFFLEVVGYGLEHTMVDQHGYKPHLSVSLDLHKKPIAAYARNLRDWYIRGRILVTWLEATGNKKQILDGWILDGISTLLDDINKYLNAITNNTDHQSAGYWEKLGDLLCEIVKTSGAAYRTKKWREKRREEFKDLKPRTYSRFTAPLPDKLRCLFIKMLGTEKHDISFPIDDRIPWKTSEQDWIFKHVFDLPWQCALIRARDFQVNIGLPATKTSSLYREINTDTSLGRRLFFTAIEIDYASYQPPCERLRTIYSSLQKDNNLTSYEKISEWIKKAESSLNEELRYRGDCTGNSEKPLLKIQKEQGELIEEFLALDCANKTNSLDPVIKHYISSRKKIEHKSDVLYPYGNSLVNILNMGTEDIPRFELLLMSRLITANRQPHIEYQFDIDDSTNNNATIESEDIKEFSVKMLGNYDQIVLRVDTKPLCRCPTPTKNQNPLFSSRETWIRTRVTKNSGDQQSFNSATHKIKIEDKSQIFLFIQLKRRYTRLDFLSWLRDSFSDSNSKKPLMLTSEDEVFLTDGWADVVILYNDERSNRKLLANLNDIQKEATNNTFVDKTETLLTANTINNLSGSIDCSDEQSYILKAWIRLVNSKLNSDPLTQAIEELKSGFKKKLSNENNTIVITSSSGLWDVSVVLITSKLSDCHDTYEYFENLDKGSKLHSLIDSYSLFIATNEMD